MPAYAPEVLSHLEANASAERIADYLTSVVRDRIELPAKLERDNDVSSMLRQLRAIGE